MSSDAKGLGGHCGCERRGHEAGVEGLIFLVTRVWVGREAPLGIMAGNVTWGDGLLLDRRDRWTLLIFCYVSVMNG